MRHLLMYCVWLLHAVMTGLSSWTETLGLTKPKILALKLSHILIWIPSNLKEKICRSSTLNDSWKQEVNHGSCVGGKGRPRLTMYYFRPGPPGQEKEPASRMLDRATWNWVQNLWQKGAHERHLVGHLASMSWS